MVTVYECCMMGDVEIFTSLLKVILICITSFESHLPLHQHTKLREPRIYVPVCGEEIGNWGKDGVGWLCKAWVRMELWSV
jgi:hypothetical protein